MAILVLLSALFFFQAAAAHCNAGLLEATWGLIEDGEIEPFSLVLRNNLLETASSGKSGEIYALGATLTAVSELSWVRPDSACAYSNLINANLNLGKGRLSRATLSSAIDEYAITLAKAVENLRILGQSCVLPSPWPVLDNCCGDYGRIYPFEASWDSVSSFSSSKARCASRDLYTALNARSNNVGAAATSAATTPALSIVKIIEGDLVSYLQGVTSPIVGCECTGSRSKKLRTLAGKLKSSIFTAANQVKSNLYSSCH
ncbi:fibroin light chain-like [Arctopsyche grandis]|uniref:fibroin light chain-like n=1 Tax=Arctopsyche grandis TaxID=121162 RepID=UPI00406D8478